MQSTRDIIKKVKKLEITTSLLVEGLITGNYHSVFKGQGIEFSDIRDYRPGDDVRAIDWKVTARFNHPFIKEFIEERDIESLFCRRHVRLRQLRQQRIKAGQGTGNGGGLDVCCNAQQ